MALAHFGHAVNMISTVASNELGEAASGELRRHGVDTRHVAAGQGRMGLYFLQTGASQRPSQVLYDRANSAFALAAPDSYDWSRLLDGARALHVSGVTPAVGPNAAAAAIAAVRAARERGFHVVFDGNYRSKLWQAWDSNPPRVLREIFSCADTVFADHRDLALVLDSDFSSAPSEHVASSAAAAAFDAFPQLQRIVSTQRLQHSVDDHDIGASLITRTHALEAKRVRVAGIVDRIGRAMRLRPACCTDCSPG